MLGPGSWVGHQSQEDSGGEGDPDPGLRAGGVGWGTEWLDSYEDMDEEMKHSLSFAYELHDLNQASRFTLPESHFFPTVKPR